MELLSFLKYFEVQLSKTHTESTEYIKTAIIKTNFLFYPQKSLLEADDSSTFYFPYFMAQSHLPV